eukprot:768280-Hanusia_phi.AAC.1
MTRTVSATSREEQKETAILRTLLPYHPMIPTHRNGTAIRLPPRAPQKTAAAPTLHPAAGTHRVRSVTPGQDHPQRHSMIAAH